MSRLSQYYYMQFLLYISSKNQFKECLMNQSKRRIQFLIIYIQIFLLVLTDILGDYFEKRFDVRYNFLLQRKKMIKINAKSNPKLLSQFPHDPYYNITIRTKTQELHLDIAYLIIDSKFFEQYVQNKQKIVDLSHLPQQALMRVLKSLYGAQLQAESVDELMEIYIILDALDIEDYKINIMDQIMQKPSLKNSIEMLQFSYKHGLCFEQFKHFHCENKLKLLEDNRSYLKLNKVSSDAINTILMEYQQLQGEASHQTINNILENFLNRNAISPSDYFENPQITVLKQIWEKFHHSLQYVQKIKSERVKSSNIFSSIQSIKSINKTASNEDSKNYYQTQLKQKDLIIDKLYQEKQELLKLLSRYMDTKNLQLDSNVSRGRIQSDITLKIQTKSNQFYKKPANIPSYNPRTPIQHTKKISILNQNVIGNCRSFKPYQHGHRVRMANGQQMNYNSPSNVLSPKHTSYNNKQDQDKKSIIDLRQIRTLGKISAGFKPTMV